MTFTTIRTTAAAAAAVLFLAGCATAPQPPTAKADYKEFTDARWLPETAVRAPKDAKEAAVTTEEALKNGIHVFYGPHDTRFALNAEGNRLRVTESQTADKEPFLSWGAGAHTLFRNSKPVANTGAEEIRFLEDGRALIRFKGDANYFLAVAVRAYDVSGKPVRQYMRDGNNLPTALAWYTDKNAVFPEGSLVYQTTWWLGDDEIVMPAKAAFTGASSLERLTTTFTRGNLFCLPYVNHQGANPWGVTFDPVKRSRRAAEGGKWKVRTIRGNRVMELIPNDAVAAADIGIQPVNAGSMAVGFAEVAATDPAEFARQSKTVRRTMRVVPVRILKSNQPITDFRLRYNDTAAAAVKAASDKALEAKQYWEASSKKVILK